MSPSTKGQRAGVLAVALLAGASVRLDEIYYRRPFGDWNWPDWIVGALLAVCAAVAVVGAQRLMESRRRITELARRSGGIADTAWMVSRGGHTGQLLGNLTEQACEVLGVERATVSLRADADPRSYTIVAGHGVNGGVIGSQFGIDEGVLGEVFMTGEPVLAPGAPAAHQGPAGGASGDAPHEGVLGVCAGGGAPIRWGDEVRGALWAGTADPGREFGSGELESLSRLADLGALALEQAEMRERLENAVGSGVEALAEAIDMRDNYTWQHSKNVAELADRVADRLGLTHNARAELSFAARLHDVGKLALPDGILMKAGDLNEDEWEIMRQYPLRGAELLERVPGLGNVAQIVLCEHEHWDGSGYPKGMCGEDIPLASRVILACDAYDAMVHDRPWRSALKPWAAVRELRLGAGRDYDPQVVMALIAVLRESRASTALSALWSPRLRERV